MCSMGKLTWHDSWFCDINVSTVWFCDINVTNLTFGGGCPTSTDPGTLVPLVTAVVYLVVPGESWHLTNSLFSPSGAHGSIISVWFLVLVWSHRCSSEFPHINNCTVLSENVQKLQNDHQWLVNNGFQADKTNVYVGGVIILVRQVQKINSASVITQEQICT